MMVSSCAHLFNGKSSSRNRNEILKLVVYLMILSHVFILCGLYNDDFKNLALTFLTLLYTKALHYPLKRRQKKMCRVPSSDFMIIQELFKKTVGGSDSFKVFKQ